MTRKQDYFISHASADKEAYIEPLTDALEKRDITFWIDKREIELADSIPLEINEGLRHCRRFLICLSPAYLQSAWAESELAAVLNPKTKKRLVPLILREKELVLNHYPLLREHRHCEYSEGVDKVADELRKLVGRRDEPAANSLHIKIESVHSGTIGSVSASRNASIHWLSEQARMASGLKNSLDTGGFQPFPIRWVLVDARAEDAWDMLGDREQEKTWAVVMRDDSPHICRSKRAKLGDIGVYDGIVFHLYAVQQREPPRPSGTGGGGVGRPGSIVYIDRNDDDIRFL